MNKAVLLHGTDNKPSDIWYPWVTSQLERHGYEVFAPLLPNNHTPNRQEYEEFLKGSGWDFTDNVLVGHSSGATTVLNLLMADWFPHIKAAALVGTFLNERLVKAAAWYDPGQFDNLFLDYYDPDVLRAKADSFVFVHGSDDPHCDINDARQLCKKLGGRFVEIEGGGHLSASSGRLELPELLQGLQGRL